MISISRAYKDLQYKEAILQTKFVFFLGLGYWIVKTVDDSQYPYDTNTLLANADLAISYPMQSAVDGHVRINPLDIDWQKFPAIGKNGTV